jgi:DNA-binding transcriptional LysR family regulator
MRDAAGMEIFVRVVEKGSFSAAAVELNLTPSAVSKQVSRLEAELGVRLINRSTHDFSLTEAGKIYHERCLKILHEIDQARDAVQEANATLSGTLKLHVTPGTGQLMILPHLNRFLREHPGLSVDLHIEPDYVDVLQNGLDLSIRSGTDDDTNLRYTSIECRPLASVRYLVCAAPDYFRRKGKPKEPRDLARHDCIIYASQPSADRWWFSDKGKRYAVHVTGRLRADDWSAVHNAALDGVGIARLLALEAMPSISHDQLEVIFERQTICDRRLWAFFPRTRHTPRKVAAFLECLAKAFGVPPTSKAADRGFDILAQ